MKIHFYHKFSELDNIHEFGVVPDNDNKHFYIHLAWIFFHLGQELLIQNVPRSALSLFPYKVFSWGEPIKTYKIYGADKVAKLIVKRIIKILNT